MNKIIFILICALSITSSAQVSVNKDAKVKPAASTTVATESANNGKSSKVKLNFEDELVTGSGDKPAFDMILQSHQYNYKKMIHLRDNFIPEVYKNKDDLRAGQ